MKKLDLLVNNKTIKSYRIITFDENGNEGEGEFRNTEQLTIEFNDGEILKIDTMCSGCLENTVLCIS